MFCKQLQYQSLSVLVKPIKSDPKSVGFATTATCSSRGFEAEVGADARRRIFHWVDSHQPKTYTGCHHGTSFPEFAGDC